MINSWKQLWAREHILVSLGIVFGLIIGYVINDESASFQSIGHSPRVAIEIFGYQISPPYHLEFSLGLQFN